MLTLQGALAVFAGDGREFPGAHPGDVHTGGGRIQAERAEGSAVLDVSGCVVTPGLVNAHHHLFQTAFRTLPDAKGVPMAQWLPTMAAAYSRAGVDPEIGNAAARAGLAEALLCGVTTVADHHLTWPGLTPAAGVEFADAVRSAAAELGARLVFVRGSANDDPQIVGESAEAIAAQWFVPEDGGVTLDGMVQLAVGPAGVHSDRRETFDALADVARRYGLRRRTQANEQVDVAVAAQRYGRRPIELLDEWGWLAPDVTLAHLCAVTDGEIARLASAGVSATHAPGCDLPMGWGVAPVGALLDAGVPVGMGTSGGGSNDAGHLLADGRTAMQVAPLAGRELPARDVLTALTRGGAVGLGRPELGIVEVGAAADLCVWDVTGVADAGVADPVAGLLWASPGRRPRHVLVGGELVVRDYRLVTADERAVATHLRGVLADRG
ncbi:amidohydrolase family protein [Rhodococcus sp. HNM0569]|uniref:amidohydrolase family protein n=1 Tax=Rhodococcus sp. HNM0569 TaxID=2716340 RepID=UPI00146B43C4|nr:amidohydrolase family protein [Rhodococcus sp. HNM0569]NLU83653.1 amidohydrolase family protein [Rhodococcus sp. HNM0569]